MFTRFFDNDKKSSQRRRVPRGARHWTDAQPPTLESLEDRYLLSWTTGGTFPAGQNPGAIAVGSFRGSEQDVAVVDGAGTVNVLLGDGQGHFQAPVAYRVGDGPTAVAVADLRGNGISDLVVTNRGSDTVSVLLGNGDGTFQTAVNFATGGGPRAVAVGDFNGDGIPDLAVTSSSGANAVDILLGNGDGTFQAPVAYAVGFAPISVAAAQLTPSGNLDLVVANELDKTVSVLLGNGDGTFQNAVNYDTGVGTFSDAVAVGDFNGDGIPDIAVANDSQGVPNGTGFVGVLLGNGNGTFQPAVSYMLGDESFRARPFALTVGDLNNNGTLDLVTANIGVGVGVSLLLGNGDGTFGQDRFADLPPFFLRTAAGVAVGDFHGGGFLDIAVTDTVDHSLKLFLNTGPGRGPEGGSGSAGKLSPESPALADVFAGTAVATPRPVAANPQATARALDAAFAARRNEAVTPPKAPAIVNLSTAHHGQPTSRAAEADAVGLPDPLVDAL